MALDKRNFRQLVDTTVEIANKVGSSEIINRIVDDLKDESEPYRKMVAEAVHLVVQRQGAADVGPDLERRRGLEPRCGHRRDPKPPTRHQFR